MTTHDRDKIIAAAKEAGMHVGSRDDPHTALWWYPEVERFYAIAHEAGRQAERGECAKVCEERIGGAVKPDEWWSGFKSAMSQCASAIRTRRAK